MNYNTLRNKPTINHKELIGNNKASDIGGMTEEDMQELLETDLTPYYNKDEIDDLFARSFVYREKSGSIVTFDCPSTSQSIPELTVGIEATQSGSGDPSPTNVRPISGWSAVNVTRSGVNVWDEEWRIDGEQFKAKNLIPVKPNTSYYFKRPLSAYSAFKYDINGTSLGTIFLPENAVFTTDSETYYIWFSLSVSDYGTTYNNDISINYPSTDTSYHAYNGQTYTTDLKDANDQPLTCYGGQLENVNGVQSLVLTHGYIASYNGETLPSTWISDRDVYTEGTTPTTGAEVVYELATPQQISQDNLAIATQDGTNNLWADSGDIEVKCLDRIIPAGE